MIRTENFIYISMNLLSICRAGLWQTQSL